MSTKVIKPKPDILFIPQIYKSLDPKFKHLLETDNLDELLIPNPQNAAKEIVKRIIASNEGTVNLLYSLSMFSGKTRAAIRLAKILNDDQIPILAVQPLNETVVKTRFGEKQESEMMTHQLQNPESFPTKRISTNFRSAIDEAMKLSQKKGKKRVLIIDEGMFFIDHNHNPEEAVKYIEQIRRLGIHVVITGIIRNFKAAPFIVMDHLVKESKLRENWDSIQMTTQCAFCSERAKGTARYIIKNDIIRLATLEDPDVVTGSNDKYIQVCVNKHPSFAK